MLQKIGKRVRNLLCTTTLSLCTLLTPSFSKAQQILQSSQFSLPPTASSSLASSEPSLEQIIKESEPLFQSGILPASSSYVDETVSLLMNLMFPEIPGTSQVMFMPYRMWGRSKVHNPEVQFRKYESAHMLLYTYNVDNYLIERTLDLLEHEFKRNARFFEFARFSEKFPFVLYNNRKDYQQSNFAPLGVLEASGGMTSVDKKRRIALPYENGETRFSSVIAHEFFHAYSITVASELQQENSSAFSTPPFPLWWVEGTAEYRSDGCHADWEPVIRDLFLNVPGFQIDILEQLGGHPLVYPLGCLMTEALAKNFGEQKITEIYKQEDLPFEENVQKALKISLEEWYSLTQRMVEESYQELKTAHTSLDEAAEIASENLLATFGERFLTMARERGKLQLRLNQLDDEEKIISETIAESGNLAVERLFGDANLDASRVVYVAHNKQEEVVVQEYFSEEKQLALGTKQAHALPQFALVSSPVFVDADTIAFIGTEEKYTDVYLYNLKSRQLEKLTDDFLHEAGLAVHDNTLVFSREDDKNHQKPYTYDRHLYALDLAVKKKEVRQLTFGQGRDTEPSFSPDGSQLLFTSDRDGNQQAYLYDFNENMAYLAVTGKTGILQPLWIGQERVLFNDIVKLSPRLLAYALPTPAEMEEEALLHAVEHVHSSPKAEKGMEKIDAPVDLLNPSDSSLPVPAPTWGELQWGEKEKVTLSYAGEGYRVTGIIPLDEKMYLRAIPDRPIPQEIGKQDVPAGEQWFSFKDGKLSVVGNRKLFEKHELEKILGTDSKKAGAVRKHFFDETIIETLLSPDQRYVALILNYDLSLEPEINKAGEIASMVKVIDLEKRTEENIFALRNIPAEGAIHFLAGGKIVLFQGGKGGNHSDRKGIFTYLFEDLDQARPAATISSLREDDEFVLNVNHEIAGRALSSSGRFLAFTGENESSWVITRYDSLKDTVQKFTFDAAAETMVRFGFSGEELYLIHAEEGSSVIDMHRLKEDALELEHLQFAGEGKLEEFTLDRLAYGNGKIALIVKNENMETELEKLLVADFVTNELKAVGEEYIKFSRIWILEKSLVYQGEDRTGKVETKTLGAPFFPLEKMVREEDTLFFSDGKDLFRYKPDSNDSSPDASDLLSEEKNHVQRLATNVSEFEFLGNRLFYSAYDGKHFRMHLKDLVTGQEEILPQSSAFLPQRQGDSLIYFIEHENNLGFVVAQLSGKNVILHQYFQQGYDLGNPLVEERKVSFTKVKSEHFLSNIRNIVESSPAFAFRDQPRTAAVERVISLLPFADYDFSLLGGIGIGSRVVFFGQMRGYATDELQNNLLLLNLLSNGNSFFSGNLTYINLPKDFGASLYAQQYAQFSSFGNNFSKFIPFGKFYRLSLTGGYEHQNSLFRDNNHVVKVGLAYGLDTAPMDFHGPFDGSRLFLQSTYGFSLSEMDDNNIDLNLDARHYLPLVDRVALAFRAAAGTSQGPSPTQFILGGVDDIRGAGFLSLYGQNYYFAASEFRFPVAEIAGVILPEPVASASSLTAAWDVRGKIFAYVGDVFQNNDVSAGLVDIPNFGMGPGLDFYYTNLRFTFTWNMYGKVDPPGGKANPGWWKEWNMFIMIVLI